MITSFKEIVEHAKTRGGKRIAVAGAAAVPVLEALKIAVEADIAEPVLIGQNLVNFAVMMTEAVNIITGKE